jgi:predicted amidophosphoribosyltransferase
MYGSHDASVFKMLWCPACKRKIKKSWWWCHHCGRTFEQAERVSFLLNLALLAAGSVLFLAVYFVFFQRW